MIFIASLVLLLIIKLRFPKGKCIHRVIQKDMEDLYLLSLEDVNFLISK